ncbi:MAG: hypothetical protein A2W31_01510 [Planctomycetes bacterium RBG_16_64_10]|nr:MAG: hypothetical protein A2W31_01510 [Planctomycetes bacterium RBG_16_64_10]
MAKTPENPDHETTPAATTGTAAAPETPPQPPPRPQLQVDDAKAVTCYANFCRVTGTPEELIVDFGLNTQPIGVPTEKIVITERIVLNYYTAKRLLAALQMSVQRHEAAFGVLETDIQKRVQPSARRQAPPPSM